mmetsp:Transcript_13720/g.31305  ORF Transcript_13720/g.31305 Transcript_13720/m.31305 type:complete len:716 (-) Transcript_13720:160-2307(-)
MSHGGLGLQPSTSSSALFTAPSSSRVRRASSKLKLSAETAGMSDDEDYDRAGGGGGGKAKSKSRRELPAGAVATLKAWLLSPEHFTHPYPTPQDQVMLMQKTGIDKKQLKNWFTNARRRIWKPMLKKQLEAGKLAAAGGGMAIQATAVQAASAQASQKAQAAPPREEMYQNYQQAAQEEEPAQEQRQYQQPQVQYQQQPPPQQQAQVVQALYDQYGNQVFLQPDGTYATSQPQPQQQQQQVPETTNIVVGGQAAVQQQAAGQQQQNFPISNSIGSLAPMNPTSSINSFGKMIKTDSHAVLMELFARDQDLVRQANAASRGVAHQQQQQAQQQQGLALQTQHHGAAQPPAVLSNATLQSGGASGNLRSYASAIASGGTASSSAGLGQKQQSVTFQNDGGLSSWPHFSSVSSLNNMGGLSGVKSITNLSSADLASQGNLNRMGNLAQVKSSENMGKADSFAFLEVFFNNKEGSGNQQVQRGVKRERDEDDGAIGLSLDGDDAAGPSSGIAVKQEDEDPNSSSSAVKPAPLTGDENAEEEDGGGLKRAYDDALAARGLIAVRQSSEKLTDLALPAKMQRTLSQEYIRQHNQGAPMGDFFNAQASSAFSPNRTNRVNGVGTFGQATAQQQAAMGASDQSVQVPSTTKCSLCYQTNVDTQLRPCGHMFHGSCLKPSLQQNGAACPPKCPICGTPMQSAILAIPTATQQPNLHLVGGMELQ